MFRIGLISELYTVSLFLHIFRTFVDYFNISMFEYFLQLFRILYTFW